MSTGPEKTVELWIACMELSCVVRRIIVVDLEVTAALLYGCVPADSFEDGFGPVIPEPTLHDLEGR